MPVQWYRLRKPQAESAEVTVVVIPRVTYRLQRMALKVFRCHILFWIPSSFIYLMRMSQNKKWRDINLFYVAQDSLAEISSTQFCHGIWWHQCCPTKTPWTLPSPFSRDGVGGCTSVFLSDRRWGLRTADFGPAIGRAQPHWKLPTRWIFEISFVELSIGAAKNLADNTLHIACSFPRIAVDSQGYFWAGLFRLRGRAKVKTF